MELTLTKQQKRYLNDKGFISPSTLQKAFKQSVKEQQEIKKAADKLRKSEKNGR